MEEIQRGLQKTHHHGFMAGRPTAPFAMLQHTRGNKMKISLFTQVLPTQIKSESGFVSAACEMCVTDDFDDVDGPDYSADGQWIWFNGEREGGGHLAGAL